MHAAAEALAACDRPAACPPATVVLHSGVHELGGRPLHLGGAQRWVGEPGATLSGGVSVTGWRPTARKQLATGETTTHWTAPLPQGARPKSMRVGMARAPEVTFPSVDNALAASQYLYARQVNVSTPGTADTVRFDTDALPAGWAKWTNLVAYTWPGSSWVGMRLSASPTQTTPTPDHTHPSEAGTDNLASFKFESATGVSNLRTGNRVRFAGAPELLGEPGTSGVWAVDARTRTVHLLSKAEPEDVWLPQLDRLVTIESRSDVTLRGVTFTDTDFVSTGLQNGFNAVPSDPGIPHDAAVAVSNSSGVLLQNCTFLALGGCGVVIGNRSTAVVVNASTFTDMGQSAVLFVGNDTSQARECVVSGNVMRGIGTILASAGGVVASSASNLSVTHNDISDCSRWGIAVRSNPSAGSWNNSIGPGNRIVRTGLTTADFGAISFIDHTNPPNVSGNRIVGNCVRDTRSMRDTMWRGVFGDVLSAFWGRSVYLDDRTSFTEISGNVFVDSSVYHIFFHSGSNNTVENNVFVNGSLQNPGTQILLKQITHTGPPGPGARFPMHGNQLNRNIFIAPPNFTKFFSGDAAADGAWANVSEPYISSVRSNLYFQPRPPSAAASAFEGASRGLNLTADLFFDLSWGEWREKGWDAGSLVNLDPEFVDLAAGDFRLSRGSPALGLGFEALPNPHCPP